MRKARVRNYTDGVRRIEMTLTLQMSKDDLTYALASYHRYDLPADKPLPVSMSYTAVMDEIRAEIRYRGDQNIYYDVPDDTVEWAERIITEHFPDL